MDPAPEHATFFRTHETESVIERAFNWYAKQKQNRGQPGHVRVFKNKV